MSIGSLPVQDFPQQLIDQYHNFKEASLTHRRFKHDDILPLIEKLPSKGFQVIKAGASYQGRPVYHVSIGTGKEKVLLWSQMHGDEATATMALFDIFNFLGGDSPTASHLLSELSLHFVPMLNPDGTDLFQRRTSQGIDMNRDALCLEGPESRILKSLRDSLDADWGFNLHDQNIYYTIGEKPATMSFLAPAYNQEKDVNEKRGDAMKVIIEMNKALQAIIPGQVGKYDDTFEPRAFGDNIQKWGTRTILIESGGFAGDPEKQFIRKLNFVAILTAMKTIADSSYRNQDLQDYLDIPFNESNLNDVLIRNVRVNPEHGKPYHVDIAIRREELDHAGKEPLFYRGKIEDLGDLSTQYGYQEFDASGMEYATGNIYPDIPDNQNEVFKKGLSELLAEGYTYMRFGQQQDTGTYELPFDVIGEVDDLPGVPRIEQPATFLLHASGDIKYVVINGFVHRVGEPVSSESNGWIY
jgi:hypothetical protein